MHVSKNKLFFTFLLFLFLAQANNYKWDLELSSDITGGVIIDNNYAYITSRNTLSRINLIEQKTEWEVLTSETTLEPIKYGGMILVPVREGKIYQINIINNRIIKEIETGNEITANPLLADNRVYVPTKEKLICVDANTGNIVWEKNINIITSVQPINTKDSVILLGNDGKINMLSKNDGRIIFNDLKYDDSFWFSSGEIKNGQVVFGGEKGRIYIVSENNPKITFLNKQTVDGTPLSTTPVFLNNNIIYATKGGKICEMTTSGEHIWCLTLATATTSRPIVTNKWIYVAANDGNVHGIDHNGTLRFTHEIDASILRDAKKVGSMIYLTSREGRFIAVSTSSCEITYPNNNEDVSGIDVLDVEINAFADTEINGVFVKINEGSWINTEHKEGKYLAQISENEIKVENNIYCKVTSMDGDEKPPYNNIYITKTGQGKIMDVNVPDFIGYKSSYNLIIKDENGNDLDRVIVKFGNEEYRDVDGEITLTPETKGEFELEVRRPGYIPVKKTIKVDDDYTYLIGGVIILLLLGIYAFTIYRKWMRE
jgi:hypothetical protein